MYAQVYIQPFLEFTHARKYAVTYTIISISISVSEERIILSRSLVDVLFCFLLFGSG